MEKTWQVQDAKARFSEFLDASLKQGPQIVTRRGVEAAALWHPSAGAAGGLSGWTPGLRHEAIHRALH